MQQNGRKGPWILSKRQGEGTMISCHFQSMRRIPKEHFVETEKKLTILARPPWNYTPQKRTKSSPLKNWPKPRNKGSSPTPTIFRGELLVLGEGNTSPTSQHFCVDDFPNFPLFMLFTNLGGWFQVPQWIMHIKYQDKPISQFSSICSWMWRSLWMTLLRRCSLVLEPASDTRFSVPAINSEVFSSKQCWWVTSAGPHGNECSWAMWALNSISSGPFCGVGAMEPHGFPSETSTWRWVSLQIPAVSLKASKICWGTSRQNSGRRISPQCWCYVPYHPWDWYIYLHLVDFYGKYTYI